MWLPENCTDFCIYLLFFSSWGNGPERHSQEPFLSAWEFIALALMFCSVCIRLDEIFGSLARNCLAESDKSGRLVWKTAKKIDKTRNRHLKKFKRLGVDRSGAPYRDPVLITIFSNLLQVIPCKRLWNFKQIAQWHLFLNFLSWKRTFCPSCLFPAPRFYPHFNMTHNQLPVTRPTF